jgi:hypothetical protein
MQTFDFHIGSGAPFTSIPQCLRDETDGGYQSACASMCSAASTVVSALNSIESTSFPASSETSFDLANKVTLKFLAETQYSWNRKRAFEAENEWRRSASPPVIDCSSERDCGQFETRDKRRRTAASTTLPINNKALEMRAESNLEEFSLGSGIPHAVSEAAFLCLLMNKVSP